MADTVNEMRQRVAEVRALPHVKDWTREFQDLSSRMPPEVWVYVAGGMPHVMAMAKHPSGEPALFTVGDVKVHPGGIVQPVMGGVWEGDPRWAVTPSSMGYPSPEEPSPDNRWIVTIESQGYISYASGEPDEDDAFSENKAEAWVWYDKRKAEAWVEVRAKRAAMSPEDYTVRQPRKVGQ